MKILTSTIKQLRDKTSAGILDCKEALEKTDGDLTKAKEFLKKNPNCKSQILSDNQVVLIYSIDQTQRMTSLIKPVSMTLNKRTNEKTKQKI